MNINTKAVIYLSFPFASSAVLYKIPEKFQQNIQKRNKKLIKK